MVAGSRVSEGAAFDFDDWHRRCEGFRVDSLGRVGFGADVRYGSRGDRPGLIAVRGGLLGRLLLVVPVGEIADILPGEERIALYCSPRPAAPERLQDGRGQIQPGTDAEPRQRLEGVAAGAEHIETKGVEQ